MFVNHVVHRLQDFDVRFVVQNDAFFTEVVGTSLYDHRPERSLVRNFKGRHRLACCGQYFFTSFDVIVPRFDRLDIDAGLIHNFLVVIDYRGADVETDTVIFTVFAVNIETGLDKL